MHLPITKPASHMLLDNLDADIKPRGLLLFRYNTSSVEKPNNIDFLKNMSLSFFVKFNLSEFYNKTLSNNLPF